jgi:hypothetical protein
MRRWLPVIAVLLLAPTTGAGAEDAKDRATISVELNKAETNGAKCRMFLVIAEKAGKALQSLKTDLVVFAADGAIAQRTLAELGPVKARKTAVKAFDFDLACKDISGVLVNGVGACAPAVSTEDCLERLDLKSRVAIRLFL